MAAENLVLNNSEPWLYSFIHSSLFPLPATVLVDGKHPSGGAPKAPIRRAPKLYNSFRIFTETEKLKFMNEYYFYIFNSISKSIFPKNLNTL